MSHKQGLAKKGWFRTPKRKLIALSAVAVLTSGGFFGVQAFTKSQAYGHMKLFAGYHSCAGGDHHVSFSDIPDDELKTRIACMVKLGAGEVDASGAQQGAGRLYGGDEIVDCTVYGFNVFGQF